MDERTIVANDYGSHRDQRDQRPTSTEAKRILREQGLNEKQMRGKVDMISASLFLQAWLDSHGRKDDRG